MHYIIIGVIILIILILQFGIFVANWKHLKLYKRIIPESDLLGLYQSDPAISPISYSIENKIIDILNKYLLNNKGAVSDYHLMKDIVDRNCDAKEDEIQAQIPIPLYLGLAGTMLGILIGLGFLVFTGQLSELLNLP